MPNPTPTPADLAAKASTGPETSNTDTTDSQAAADTAASNGHDDATDDEFTPITSQADFDRAIGKRIAREREKVAAQFSDYDQLKAIAETKDDLTQTVASLKTQMDALIAERDEARTSALRVRIATETGIPEDLIVGTDEDSMKAHAEAIAALIAARDAGGPASAYVKSLGGSDTPATTRESLAQHILLG